MVPFRVLMITQYSLDDADLPPPLEDVHDKIQPEAYNSHEALTPRSRAFLEETVHSYFERACTLAMKIEGDGIVEEVASSEVVKESGRKVIAQA